MDQNLLAELLGEEIPQLTLPTKDTSKYGVSLIGENVQKAIDYFGIKNPVVLKWSSGRYTVGCHRFYEKNSVLAHRITLTNYRNSEETSKTLWHELCHAFQTERYSEPKRFYKDEYQKYSKTSGTKKYRRNPYEIEARNSEKNHTLVCSLAE